MGKRGANFVTARGMPRAFPRRPFGVRHSLAEAEQPVFDAGVCAVKNIGGREVEDDADDQQPSEGEKRSLVALARAHCFRSESVHAAYKRPLMNATLTAAKAIMPAVTSVVIRTSASDMKESRRMTVHATIA